MKNTIKKFFLTLLTLALVLSEVPATTCLRAQAAEKSPYAATYGWACTMDYFSYGADGIAVADASRSVSFVDSTVVLNGKQLTNHRLAGTQPFWNNGGSHLFWIEADGIHVYTFGTRTSVLLPNSAGATLAEGVDGFLGNIKLSNGNLLTAEQAIAKLPGVVPGGIVGATPTPSPTVAPTTTPTVKPSATPVPTLSPSPAVSPTASPVVTVPPALTPVPIPTSTPHGVLIGKPTATPTTASGKVEPFLDAAGRMHYKYGVHEIIVDGSMVYADGIRISELCNSGVRYLGAVPQGVYLLEDSTGAYYRFSWDNLFCPEKLRFADGCILVKVIYDDNGYMKAIETSTGTYSLNQLVVDKEWAPAQTYAMNKFGYCSFYWAETGTGHTLELKEKSLFLDGTLQVASGAIKVSEGFGAQKGYLVVQKGTQAFRAPWSNPTQLTLWKQNVAKLEYSSSNGLVVGVKYLDQKLDWCKNSAKKTVLYQSGAQAIQVTLNSKKTKVLSDGRVIAKLSSKDIKAGKRYSFIGVTEANYVGYGIADKKGRLVSAKKLSLEQAKTCKVNQAKKWSISSTSYDARGFLVGRR